jgi:hypothetical protein
MFHVETPLLKKVVTDSDFKRRVSAGPFFSGHGKKRGFCLGPSRHESNPPRTCRQALGQRMHHAAAGAMRYSNNATHGGSAIVANRPAFNICLRNFHVATFPCSRQRGTIRSGIGRFTRIVIIDLAALQRNGFVGSDTVQNSASIASCADRCHTATMTANRA